MGRASGLVSEFTYFYWLDYLLVSWRVFCLHYFERIEALLSMVFVAIWTAFGLVVDSL